MICDVRHGSIELTADEKSLVLQQLPTGVSHTEVDAALGVLSQILTGSTAASEEDIGEQDQVCCVDIIPRDLSFFKHCMYGNLRMRQLESSRNESRNCFL